VKNKDEEESDVDEDDCDGVCESETRTVFLAFKNRINMVIVLVDDGGDAGLTEWRRNSTCWM